MITQPFPILGKRTAREPVSKLWTFIGGAIYFAVKGWFKAALAFVGLCVVVGLVTCGVGLLAAPFFCFVAPAFVEAVEGWESA